MAPKLRSSTSHKAQEFTKVKQEEEEVDERGEVLSEEMKSEGDDDTSKRKSKTRTKAKTKGQIKAEPTSDSDFELDTNIKSEHDDDEREVEADDKSQAQAKSKSTTKSKAKSEPESEPESDLLQIPSPPLDTPALSDPFINYSYEIARGEIGVLSFEPYKSLVLPYWRFRTVPIARNSSKVLFHIFQSYVKRRDLPGADMTRKFIEMGMTRAKRYANHKGGRKYGADGKVLEKWSGEDIDGKRREKEMASEVFKGYWRKCIEDERYVDLKAEWTKAKKEYWKQRGGKPSGIDQVVKKEEKQGK